MNKRNIPGLKDCPFCGCEPGLGRRPVEAGELDDCTDDIRQMSDGFFYVVHCVVCEQYNAMVVKTLDYFEPKGAIACWNRQVGQIGQKGDQNANT